MLVAENPPGKRPVKGADRPIGTCKVLGTPAHAFVERVSFAANRLSGVVEIEVYRSTIRRFISLPSSCVRSVVRIDVRPVDHIAVSALPRVAEKIVDRVEVPFEARPEGGVRPVSPLDLEPRFNGRGPVKRLGYLGEIGNLNRVPGLLRALFARNFAVLGVVRKGLQRLDAVNHMESRTNSVGGHVLEIVGSAFGALGNAIGVQGVARISEFGAPVVDALVVDA